MIMVRYKSGFYKNGKLQGEWISYDSNGYKTAMATYDNGQKSGKWFFGAILF
jgi:antitoxin component YwqK of YwqJK toxin-antitoxin module